MREAKIEVILKAVAIGDFENIRRIESSDIPPLQFEMLNLQDQKYTNGKHVPYKAFSEILKANDCNTQLEKVHRLNLLIRRALREKFPELGTLIEGIYSGMLLPPGRVEVVECEKFLETWNELVGQKVPV